MAMGFEELPAGLARGVVDLFPSGDPADPDGRLAARLGEAAGQGRPLRVKLGIDPTGTDIHLGHSILFRRLRAFQDAGHTAVLIIGARDALPNGHRLGSRALLWGTAACTALGYFMLQSMMPAARAGQGALSFAQLHLLSTAFYGLKTVLVLVLAWRALRP